MSDWNKFIGKTFNYWTIVKKLSSLKSICICKCGNQKEVFTDNVVRGLSKSCGCYKPKRGTHNMSTSHEYYIYKSMINRCYNPKTDSYKIYGCKGIKVCDRWLESFENFIQDMGMRPSLKHSIDRFPNRKGDYSPENCRWATWQEQALNRDGVKTYLYNGKKHTAHQLAKKLFIPSTSFYRHIKKYSINKVIKLYAKRVAQKIF